MARKRIAARAAAGTPSLRIRLDGSQFKTHLERMERLP
jgi:hypothetical protein